jgi:flagellar basal body-associated protein FliL
MAKKEKLDILEITIDKKDEKELHDDIILAEREGEVSDDKQDGKDLIEKVKIWVRKPLFLVMMIAVVMLGLIAGVLISIYEGRDAGGTVELKKRTDSAIPAPEDEKMVLLEGFMVDQKDEKGNVWILFCDVALELGEQGTAKAVDSGRVDVRNVIYTVAKKATVKEGLTPDGRSRLKESMKKELNHLIGENQVKNVYFTRFEVN